MNIKPISTIYALQKHRIVYRDILTGESISINLPLSSQHFSPEFSDLIYSTELFKLIEFALQQTQTSFRPHIYHLASLILRAHPEKNWDLERQILEYFEVGRLVRNMTKELKTLDPALQINDQEFREYFDDILPLSDIKKSVKKQLTKFCKSL